MSINLSDDGTLDTVLVCSECNQEFRFNFAADDDHDSTYEGFVEDCIADVTAEHECSTEDDEPTEGDLTTTDHEKFYQYGKLALSHAANGSWYRHDLKAFPAGVLIGEFHDDHVAAIRAYFDQSGFSPNAWFISDHGNAHRIEL